MDSLALGLKGVSAADLSPRFALFNQALHLVLGLIDLIVLIRFLLVERRLKHCEAAAKLIRPMRLAMACCMTMQAADWLVSHSQGMLAFIVLSSLATLCTATAILNLPESFESLRADHFLGTLENRSRQAQGDHATGGPATASKAIPTFPLPVSPSMPPPPSSLGSSSDFDRRTIVLDQERYERLKSRVSLLEDQFQRTDWITQSQSAMNQLSDLLADIEAVLKPSMKGTIGGPQAGSH